jgi:hypothetical protein
VSLDKNRIEAIKGMAQAARRDPSIGLSVGEALNWIDFLISQITIIEKYFIKEARENLSLKGQIEEMELNYLAAGELNEK